MKSNIGLILISSIIALLSLAVFISTDYREWIVHLIESYPYLAPLFIIFLRFISIVIPPLHGSPVAFASMALLPWQEAFLYNFTGVTAGTVTAFFIARKFREPIVARFSSLQKIHQWQERISQVKQFWAFVALRTGAIYLVDYVSYAAGLSKLPFRTFILASLLVDIPVGVIFFYLGGISLYYGLYIFGAFGILIILTSLVLNYRWKQNL